MSPAEAPAYLPSCRYRAARRSGSSKRCAGIYSVSELGSKTLIGATSCGCGSCSPAQPSLDGGATKMLGRIIVYAYVVMLAISVLLEKPITLAIGP